MNDSKTDQQGVGYWLPLKRGVIAGVEVGNLVVDYLNELAKYSGQGSDPLFPTTAGLSSQ